MTDRLSAVPSDEEAERGAELTAVWDEVDAAEKAWSVARIMEAGGSKDALQRLRALVHARRVIEEGVDPTSLLSWARTLVTDDNNNCRWQALIVISESIDAEPDVVWQVVEQHGSSADEDMRAGVACVLLEELIDVHPRKILPRVNRLMQDPRYHDTVRTCWAHGDARQGLKAVLRRWRKHVGHD